MARAYPDRREGPDECIPDGYSGAGEAQRVTA
jgi:hypothetical protein